MRIVPLWAVGGATAARPVHPIAVDGGGGGGTCVRVHKIRLEIAIASHSLCHQVVPSAQSEPSSSFALAAVESDAKMRSVAACFAS